MTSSSGETPLERLLLGLHKLGNAPEDLSSPSNAAVQQKKVTMSFGSLTLVPDAAVRVVGTAGAYAVVPAYEWSRGRNLGGRNLCRVSSGLQPRPDVRLTERTPRRLTREGG
uniref:Uncharacterized protein n=1 Tax=Mantoniella antarctica TaxID=81844 RepID=A0A7S0XC16_9CHLO|mmetsp:Transcript_33725/g.84915  ORF Transcript_33725/g.84915 Transcript_33725/m.84915 type:complete len:112 (+) Transcript_33725:250-585(+)